MPGTSVQISRRAAASLAAKYEPDVSEPPRPSSTVSPASLAAMNPCVMMTCSSACHSRLQARVRREIAGRRQQARLLGCAVTHARRAAPARASTHAVLIPCAFKKDAPSEVASSSPIAMTRARSRSLISRLSRRACGHALEIREEFLEAVARDDL